VLHSATPLSHGAIQDEDRRAYIESACFTRLLGQSKSGVDVRGYFVWSLLDNF